MKLSFGFVTIEYSGTPDEIKKLSYNGQICVDGIETFIVKYDLGGPHKIFQYGKREHVCEQVIEHYGEELNIVLDKHILRTCTRNHRRQRHTLRMKSMNTNFYQNHN